MFSIAVRAAVCKAVDKAVLGEGGGLEAPQHFLGENIHVNQAYAPMYTPSVRVLVHSNPVAKVSGLIIDCPMLNWFNKVLNPFNTIPLRLYTPI